MIRALARTLGLALLSAGTLASGQEGGTGGSIEEFVPSAEAPPLEEVASPPVSSPTAQVRGGMRFQLGVDTGFEPQRSDGLSEQVVDAQGRAWLATDVKLSPSLRLLVEGRARWRGSAEQGLERGKATFEPTLGEAFIDLYTSRVDVRVGQQTLAFGANAAFAPTDVLNPRDLRENVALSEPEDAKLPVVAARALGSLGPLTFTAAWVPFFTPHRYSVVGQDEALLQPGLGQGIPFEVDASIEEQLQPHLLETERPQALPHLGDVGLRVTSELSGVRVGGSWVWVNEKLPRTTLDPELEAVLRAEERGEPPDAALLLSVQERLRAGERLVSGRYARQHVLGLEATALLRTAQLDADVGFSPAQTFYDERLRPLRKPAVTWVLGVSQAEDAPLLYSVTWLGLAVPGVEAGELLVLLEPGTARGQARTAFFHLLVAEAQYTLPGDDWELGLRATFEPVQRSFVLAPRLGWRFSERLSLGLAAEVYSGRPYSPLGYFGRNDQILGSVRVTL